MEISLSPSEVLGYASIICWLGAQFPQIIANYRNKSADGLSLPFLFNWLLGDIANFIGCVWTDQQPFQIYLAFYFCIVDFCLFFQYLYYRRFYSTQEEEICDDDVLMAEGGPQWGHYNTFPVKKPASRQRGTIPLFAIFFFTLRSISYLTSSGLTTSHSSTSHPKRDAVVVSWMGTIGNSFMDSNNQYLIGRVMAWSCTVLYLTSRMPQIWKNFERKSVEGLSIFMFIFAALGNLTYTTSIFLFENKPADFYEKELPYILGASGTLTFDIIIYMQWWKYRNNRPKRRFSCIVYDIENADYLPATIRDARSRLLPDQH